MSPENQSKELIALRDAAAQAYRDLTGANGAPPEGVLDVVAIALAACIPLFGAHTAGDTLRQLSDEDVAAGKFIHGAAQLQFADARPAFTRLAVRPLDLSEAIARLKRAGVNFSHARVELFERRVPRLRPASA